MLIQLQPQHLAIIELELELLAIELRIVLVDNAMVVGTDDNDVRGVVVLRTGEVVDVVGLDNAVSILVTNLLTANLITIVVELLQGQDDTAVNTTILHQPLLLFNRSSFVGYEELLVVALLVNLLGNGAQRVGQLLVVGAGAALHAEHVGRRGQIEPDVLLQVVGQRNLPLALTQRLLLRKQVRIALLEHSPQLNGQRRLAAIANLNDILMSRPVALHEVLVLQLRIVKLAVNQNLDVLALPVRQDGFIPRPEQRAHRHRNGHPVIQQRPVHRLLQYESIVVIHQNYIFVFYTLVYFLLSSIHLLGAFLPYSYLRLPIGLASRRSLEPLSYLSQTSPEGLGLLSTRSTLSLPLDMPNICLTLISLCYSPNVRSFCYQLE